MPCPATRFVYVRHGGPRARRGSRRDAKVEGAACASKCRKSRPVYSKTQRIFKLGSARLEFASNRKRASAKSFRISSRATALASRKILLSARLAYFFLLLQIHSSPGISRWRARSDLLRLSGHSVLSH